LRTMNAVNFAKNLSPQLATAELYTVTKNRSVYNVQIPLGNP